MAEITERIASDLAVEDVDCLLNWRNHTEESLVRDLTMQQLLDLYHASAEYVTLESWLDDAEDAPKLYQGIVWPGMEGYAP